MPEVPEWLSTALWWIGGLVLSGIIGNAAWDLLKNRVFGWAVATFAILTFNTQAARDEIYELAARQRVNTNGAMVVYIISLGAIVGFFAFMVLEWRRATLGPDPVLDGASLLALRLGLSVFGLVPAYLLSRRMLVLFQATILIDKFNRLIMVVAPALDAAEEAVLRRRFSLMRSEEEYRQIVADLVQLGEDAGFPIPPRLIPTEVAQKGGQEAA